MDQQIDEYQESIKRLWKCIKGAVFPGVALRHTRPLGFSLLLVLWLVSLQLIGDVKFAFWVVQDFESVGMLLYSLFQPVPGLLTLAGILMIMRLKKLGWVFICAFFMGRVLWGIGSIVSLIRYAPSSVESPLLDMIDIPVTSWGSNLFWLVMYVLACGFYMSQPIRKIFGVERRQITQAVVLVMGLELLELALIQVL